MAGDVRMVVDHMKIDYKGPFELNQLIRLVTSFKKEKGFDMQYNKDYEINTTTGKQIHIQLYPWKKFTDYARYNIKIDFRGYDIKKIDVLKDNKKKAKVDYGHLIIILDGFLDTDYFGRWQKHPVLLYLRMLYDKFIYKAYTHRFEERLVYDVHHLYDLIEKFLGVYKNYKVQTTAPGVLH